ncbi:MAG TPA: helix-turn-helix domain-containing protein, partial [Longimicrobiaceae bacterium]|nr:helix-turn-helix domain-containing protein [Longimicrobiaceae bacterium]
GPDHLTLEGRKPPQSSNGRGNGTHAEPAADHPFLTLREVEDRHIRRALSLAGGNLGHTAELLGIHRNTLREKLRRHRLE